MAHNTTIELLDSIQVDSFATDADRFAAKEAARRLLTRLETPFEHYWGLAFETLPLVAGLQMGVDLGIWEKWTAADKQTPGAPKTLDELVGMASSPVEPNLLRRFLKHIAALYLLDEVDVDTWKPTAMSLSLGDSSTYGDQILKCGIDHTIPSGVNLARFLRDNKYQEPLDKAKFDNYRAITGMDFFEYCAAHPEAGGSFIGLMTALRNHKMVWTEVYDTASGLIEGADLSKPLFVDVGGAHGLDAAHLVKKHPGLPETVQVVVEDLPEVVTTHAKEVLDPRITRKAHDFFTPQPVVGARAYFVHAVPHDWPDADCLRIFGEIRKAMTLGYSKLLVYEVVLPAKGATNMMTTLDLELMNCVSGLERTEEHWTRLLSEAGFKVNSISRHPRAVESVIEAVMDTE